MTLPRRQPIRRTPPVDRRRAADATPQTSRGSQGTTGANPTKKRPARRGFPGPVKAAIKRRDGGCVVPALPFIPDDWPVDGLGRRLPHPHDVKCWGATEAHHLWRQGQGGPNTEDNGKTLCESHHRWVHEHIALSLRLDLLRRRGQTSPVDEPDARRVTSEEDTP